MRRTLFIFLFVSQIAVAQMPGSSVLIRQIPGSGFQLINAKTNAALNNLIWDEVEPFVNGYARVLRNKQFSFINFSGNPIGTNEFDEARNFSNNLVAVKKESGWGFMNTSGKIVIPLKYEIAFDFKGPVTAVYADRKWSLINTSGNIIKTLDITTFYGFQNGIAKIDKDGRKGTVNINGEISFFNSPVNKATVPFIPARLAGTAAATDCPDNIDFENGSFLNWKCFIGDVDSTGTTNVITVTPSAPTRNRHTLYNRVMPSAIDPFGLFPTNPPDGSNFAVKLGNTKIGAEAERIRYAIHVPINDSNFSVQYDYAVVFEDPGHTSWSQPRFTAKLYDSAAKAYVPCATFEYISTSSLPGFAKSPVDTSVIYKPWSSVFVNLSGYGGKTMFLEFTTADCVRKGHWGYAYLDVEKLCGDAVKVSYDCDSPHVTSLNAPPGYQTYNWWDSGFAHLFASGQNVVMNPGPAINSTLWLEIIPFLDFGCRDTIPVRISGIFNADFKLMDTIGMCAPHTFTFYNIDAPSLSAKWNFGDGATATGDTVMHTFLLPGSYNVTLDVIMPGGCIGAIQKKVMVYQPVGSFYFDQAYYCDSQLVKFDAVVTSPDSLFWNFGDGNQLATKKTSVSHSYAAAGTYIAQLTVKSSYGCQNSFAGADTIKIEKLKAGFSYTLQKSCGKTVLSLADSSYSYFGITSYRWNLGDGTNSSGKTISHTYNTTGTYNIRLIITGISGCIDTIIKPIYIKVDNLPVAAITSVNKACQLSQVTFTGAIVSADSVSLLKWTSTNGTSGNANPFKVSFALSGTYTIQLIAGTINGCYDTTSVPITINPTPDVLQPANQALCSGIKTSATNFTGVLSGTQYNWSNTNNSIGLNSNGSGNIGSFTAVNNTTTPQTATIVVSPDALGCPGSSKTFTITVNPVPTIVKPANQVLCSNNSSSAVVLTGSLTTATFNWTNSNPLIGLNATGTGNIASFVATNNTGTSTLATINASATAYGCSSPAVNFTINVKPTPDVLQPTDQALCSGIKTSAINFTGAVSGTQYNWTNTNNSIGLVASGSGNIGSFNAVNNTTTPQTATIVITPDALGCPGSSKTFTIIVNPVPTIVQPANQVLCSNNSSSPVVLTGSLTTATFNWTNNNPLIGLNTTGTGNIASFVATNNTGTSTLATINASATAYGCSSPAVNFTISVNPTPDVAQPANQALCSGIKTSSINFTGAVSGTQYNWTNTNNSIGLNSNGSGNIGSFTAVNNTNTPQTATIVITPDALGCPGSTKSFTITVNPVPTIVQPANQVLCSNNSSSPVVLTGSLTTAIFNWTNSNPLIGLNATGNGNIASFVATNNTGIATSATINASATAYGCSSPAVNFTISVKPTPEVLQPTDQALCSGIKTSAINFTGTVSGTQYNWTNTNNSVGLVASGSGNIGSFTAVNNTNTPQTATIVITPDALGCPGSTKYFTITVNPVPTIVQPANQVLCSNNSSSPVVLTGSLTTATFNWTNNNPLIGLNATGTGNIASFVATNNTGIATSATINASATAYGCSSPAVNFTISVKPTPEVLQPTDQALCSGIKTSAINFTGTVSGTQYNWTNTNNSIGLVASGSGNIGSFNAVNNTTTPQTATIVVSPDALGCPGSSKTFTIIVNPVPTIVQPLNQVLCSQQSTNPVLFAASLPNTYFNWTNSKPQVGLPASGTGDISSFAGLNSTAADISALIDVSPVGGGCSGNPVSFTITIHPSPTVATNADRIVCIGTTVQLMATGASQFSWSPATRLNCSTCANPVSAPTDSMTYVVTGTNTFGCSDEDTVTLKVIKPFKMTVSPNDSLCAGESARLKASQAKTYLWSPATGLSGTDVADPVAMPNTSTRYRVIGFDGSNCFTDTAYVFIAVHPKPGVELGPDINEQTGNIITLHPAIQNGPVSSYLWSPATGLDCDTCTAPVVTIAGNTAYTLTVKNSYGCTATDRINITVFCQNSQVFIPNAFTPNGNGLNEVLMVRGKGITVKSFRIFNRWGELVFEKTNFNANDPRFGWNGRIRGVPAPPGVFVYTAEVICDNGTPYTYKGNTTILK